MHGRMIDLVGTLDFVDFVVPTECTPPSQEDLDAIANLMGVHHAAAVVDDYFCSTANKYTSCGIRAGCVLKIKDGGYLLVGHVSESLAYVDDTPFVDLNEIEAIAYLY